MLLHQVLVVSAAGLLLCSGARICSRLTPHPLERLVAAAALAAALAVVEALGLGLVGLGAQPWVLAGVALLTWLITRRLTPDAGPSLARQLLEGFYALPVGARVALGAAAGAGLAWTAWLLRYPAFDWDNLVYHIPEVVAWVQNGRPGSLVTVVPGFPYANLPITNEVLLTWGSGISRSFAVVTVWPTLTMGLLALSGWVAMRALCVRKDVALLAIGSLCAAPMLTSYQGNGANSDFPAVAWMVATSALCAAAARRRRPHLLAAAVVAGALAIGTKTTVAPLTLVALLVAAYQLRRHLGAVARPLILAAVLAVLAGGVWYVRDLVLHGSPLWPYYATPWGDPLPHIYQPNSTFFGRPLATLARIGDPGYALYTFLGGLLVLAGTLFAAMLARGRAIRWGASLTILSVLLWSIAPDTGPPYPSFPDATAFHGSLRFLIPSVAAGTLTIALAARDSRGTRRWLFAVILAVALVLNIVQLFDLGFPRVPTLATPLAGAAAGALVLGLAARLLESPPPRTLVACLSALAVVIGLSVGGHGFVARRARLREADAGPIAWFQRSGEDRRPIFMAPVDLVMLAQDDLARRLSVLPRQASCAAIARRAWRGWVVVERLNTDALLGPSTADRCVARWRPAHADDDALIYDASSLPAGELATRRATNARPMAKAIHARIIGTVYRAHTSQRGLPVS